MRLPARSIQFGGWQAALLVAALVALAAACGGDSRDGADSSSTSQGQPTSEPNPVAFAQCMRTNGIPDYPDPQPVQSSGGFGSGTRLDDRIVNNPNFSKALAACGHLMQQPGQNSQGGQSNQEQLLKFAQCIRANGVPDYPDPPTTSGGGPGMLILDNSPAFQAAMQKCGRELGFPGVPGN